MMARALARYVRPIVERSPLLAQTYRHYRDGRGLQREPVTTPWGFRFVGHPLMEQGRFEPDEVRVVERLLDGSDLLVNIGANIGYYCCIALHRGKRVLAFEPVPGNLQYLYRNLRVNGWESDAEVMPVAVGDRSGLVDIFGGGTAASLINGWAGLSENHRQTVPLTTLDTALGERFESQRLFVLMDVEGAEIDVLRGARRLLYRQPRPVWMVEVNIDEHQPHGRCINPHLAATFEMFERAGYAAWLVGPALTAVSYDEVREIARTGVNTLAGHNFVFADPAMSQFC